MVEPITDRSPAWQVYQKIAKFHPSLSDVSLFQELMRKIEAKENFHIARYNDGEWTFMLQIEPYYSLFISAHKHNKREVMDISSKLLSIIDSNPAYYIGIDSTTRALQGTIAGKAKEYSKRITKLPNLVYGDIFNAATLRLGIDALMLPLKDRFTISVGPPYMSKLGFKHHISVSNNNCWRDEARIQPKLAELISQNLDKNVVVIYSCSLLAKLLIEIYYRKFKDQITQIDIGSCIDPWCGFITRPWHKELVAHYQLKAVPDGITRV